MSVKYTIYEKKAKKNDGDFVICNNYENMMLVDLSEEFEAEDTMSFFASKKPTWYEWDNADFEIIKEK